MQVKPLKQIADKYQLVIGLDFGTSRSGFNYAYTNEQTNNEVEISNIQQWPDCPIDYAKAPTELIYDLKNKIYWGWSAQKQYEDLLKKNQLKHKNIIKRFKLELRQSGDTPVFKDDEQVFPLIDLIADYLRCMKDFAYEYIFPSLIHPPPPEKILWCLTIPAIWEHHEKARMRNAAEKAGLLVKGAENLRLVYEPEAAAIYCNRLLSGILGELPLHSRFMVIDAGGGTVDITSYEVMSNRQLKELAKNNGELCGSTFLDREFLNYLKESMSSNVLSILHNKPGVFFDLMHTWERFKCDYDPTREVDYLKLPLSFYKVLDSSSLDRLAAQQNGDDEKLHLTKSTMSKIFTPVLDNVVQEVKEHLDKIHDRSKDNISLTSQDDEVKDTLRKFLGFSRSTLRKGGKVDYIFLVGGFSNSLTLRARIFDEFAKIVGGKEHILIPHRPELAVVAGATIYGLDPTIIHSRKSKLTYGINIRMDFEEGIDAEDKKVWDPYDKRNKCDDRMDIFVHVGDDVPVDYVRTRYYRPTHPEQKSVRFGVYSTSKTNPRYVTEDQVYLLTSKDLEIPGTGLDRSMEVKMYFGEVEIRIKMKDLSSGKEEDVQLHFASTYNPDEA